MPRARSPPRSAGRPGAALSARAGGGPRPRHAAHRRGPAPRRAAPRVVAALHTIAAESLQDIDHEIDSDVLLCADDPEAKARVGTLIEGIPGMRWVDGGRFEMARVAEPLTALLVSINRTYKVKD